MSIDDVKKPLAQVKHMLAIASGKGGVGKSTVAVNLALALSQHHKQVGLLDADIYGPNQPQMLGINQKPSIEGQNFQPVMVHGIQTMSIGYLIAADAPTIWRGPMVSKALQQLLYNTKWQALDYLIVDLPPGTGDVPLTMAQKIPVTASIIVTTSQQVALLDAGKALAMFQKVKVATLGIVENMTVYRCQQCGHQAHLFGQHGAEKMAKHYQVPLLMQLPLEPSIGRYADQGRPIVIADTNSMSANCYHQLAVKVIASLDN